jgi:nicotinamidase-related amidase
MSDAAAMPRSPELLSVGDSALLVVDVQEKLIGFVLDYQRLVWNIRRLIDGAGILGVPVAASEQYPKGLGRTVPELAGRLGAAAEKIEFSCRECGPVWESLRTRGIFKVLVVGIETHVCVGQTVLDLLSDGFRVYVAVDAVGSRHRIDHETALGRMESCGATLTTTEAALFEWCERAGTPQFKQISALVRELPPTVPAPTEERLV